ncbi:MAG: putative rane protein [Francisellaceae bacterium]|nr:putative rane protein [Francisellaceae bacterium]
MPYVLLSIISKFLLIILGFSFSIAVLMPLITHGVLIYHLYKSKEGYSATHLMQSFFIEIFCTFLAILLKPFKNWALKSKPETLSSNYPPILLVHGYLHNQTGWLWFCYKLQKQYKGPIYTVNLYPWFASLKTQAQRVEEKIKIIKSEGNFKEINLIGHSMGGLVSSFYAENFVSPIKVSKVFTLGSPLQGTQLAKLGLGTSAKQMTLHHPFVLNLSKQMEASTIAYYHIASKLDNLIVPWQNALPPFKRTTQQYFILENKGHLSLLVSKNVIDLIAHHI